MKNDIEITAEELLTLYKRLPVKDINFNEIIKQSFVFPEDRDISEWVGDEIYLPFTVSANPGFLNVELTPYLKGILNSFKDPDVRTITIKKPTQTGLTLTMLILMCYILDQDPGNTLMVSPTRKMSEELSSERFLPILKSSPNLSKYLEDSKITRSEEHTSELQSHSFSSYAGCCLKKKKIPRTLF